MPFSSTVKRRRRDGHMIFPSERHFFTRIAVLFTKEKKIEKKQQLLKLNVMRDLVHLIVFRTTHKAAKGLERDTEFSTTFYMVHVHFYFCECLLFFVW